MNVNIFSNQACNSNFMVQAMENSSALVVAKCTLIAFQRCVAHVASTGQLLKSISFVRESAENGCICLLVGKTGLPLKTVQEVFLPEQAIPIGEGMDLVIYNITLLTNTKNARKYQSFLFFKTGNSCYTR